MDDKELINRFDSIEEDIKDLNRKLNNLVREHRRRWGLARYGDEIKLPKHDPTKKKDK